MWSIIPNKQNDNSFFSMKMTEIKLHSLKKKKKCLLPKPWMHILNIAAILASSVSIYLYCLINCANTTDWEPLIENQKQGRERKKVSV